MQWELSPPGSRALRRWTPASLHGGGGGGGGGSCLGGGGGDGATAAAAAPTLVGAADAPGRRSCGMWAQLAPARLALRPAQLATYRGFLAHNLGAESRRQLLLDFDGFDGLDSQSAPTPFPVTPPRSVAEAGLAGDGAHGAGAGHASVYGTTILGGDGGGSCGDGGGYGESVYGTTILQPDTDTDTDTDASSDADVNAGVNAGASIGADGSAATKEAADVGVEVEDVSPMPYILALRFEELAVTLLLDGPAAAAAATAAAAAAAAAPTVPTVPTAVAADTPNAAPAADAGINGGEGGNADDGGGGGGGGGASGTTGFPAAPLLLMEARHLLYQVGPGSVGRACVRDTPRRAAPR